MRCLAFFFVHVTFHGTLQSLHLSAAEKIIPLINIVQCRLFLDIQGVGGGGVVGEVRDHTCIYNIHFLKII